MCGSTLQRDLYKWLGSRRWLNAIAFTGHLRAVVADRYAGTAFSRYIAAAKQNRFFCSRVDRAVFGSAAKASRGGKRVPRILVVEEGASRTHVHGCFAFPAWVDREHASEILTQCWIAGPYGLNDVRCVPASADVFASNADRSWGGYIIKQVDAKAFAVDYNALVLPAADKN